MKHPLPAFHFSVDWEGTRIGFQEVTGLDLETEVIEYREGSFPTASPMKLAGLRKYGDITLKRGMVQGDNELFEWFHAIRMGQNEEETRSVTINLLSKDHEPLVKWKLSNAWVRKLVGPTLNAQGNSVAIEEMVLACDEIVVENG